VSTSPRPTRTAFEEILTGTFVPFGNPENIRAMMAAVKNTANISSKLKNFTTGILHKFPVLSYGFEF
jgi:hypothetical protein